MCPIPGDRDTLPPALVAWSLPRVPCLVPGCWWQQPGTGSHGQAVNVPHAKNLSPSPKPSWRRKVVRNLKAQAGAFPVLPETLGLGEAPGATGDGSGSSHPVGDAHKPQSLQEEVRDQRSKARRSTHTPLHPPSLIELINLAKIQRSVICLIQWEERQQQQPVLLPRSLSCSCQGLSTPGQLWSPRSSHQSHQCWPQAQHQQHPAPEELQLKIP